jgi:copper chaperone CopZ
MENAIEVNIEGMSCDGCSSRLTRLLEKHPLIEEARVDHVNGKALIAGRIRLEEIETIVEEAGFTFKGKDAPN